MMEKNVEVKMYYNFDLLLN